jgi:hypothetical protein
VGKTTVYVALLEEGTDCARPTLAEELGNGLYRLLPSSDYNSADEKWEFVPGSVVSVERRGEGPDEHLFAVASKN